MVSNIIRLSLGSLLLVIFISCNNKRKYGNEKRVSIENKCNYYQYDAHQTVSNLGCQNCHVIYGERIGQNFLTFTELSLMDSLKLVKYAFINKHRGWYSKTGTFRASRMDTLSDCEIKSAIRYIKDAGRSIAIPSQ